jgi:hypothetical protein
MYDHDTETDGIGRVATRESLRWYGWGSPVGLALFVLLLSGAAAVIKLAFFH